MQSGLASVTVAQALDVALVTMLARGETIIPESARTAGAKRAK